MSELNDKQRRFAEEYLVDLNAKQAAIRAGYSAKTAEAQGSRLLSHVEVQTLIAELMASRSERTAITADVVLQQVYDIAFADPNDLVQYRRQPCEACFGGEPSGDEPDADCQACKGEGEGRAFFADTRRLRGPARRLYAGVRQTRDGLQMQMRSQDGALGLLFDHLGLAAPKRQELAGPGGGPIEVHPLADAFASMPKEKRDAIRAAIKGVVEQ